MTWLLQISSVVLLLFYKKETFTSFKTFNEDWRSSFSFFLILSLFHVHAEAFACCSTGLAHSPSTHHLRSSKKIPFEALMGLRLLKFTPQLSAPKRGFLAERIRICCDSISGKLRFILERLKLNWLNKFQLCCAVAFIYLVKDLIWRRRNCWRDTKNWLLSVNWLQPECIISQIRKHDLLVCHSSFPLFGGFPQPSYDGINTQHQHKSSGEVGERAR